MNLKTKQELFIKKHKRNNLLIKLTQLILVISFISLWEFLSSKNIINSFIFSSPSKVIKTIISLYNQNNLWPHIFTTLKEVLISFSLGFILSLITAIIFYLIKPVYKVLDPFITMLNSLPKVAIGPLILIWFGANINSIIIMALLINYIVSLLTIYTGFISTNKDHITLFKTFNASKFQILTKLVIPTSITSIISSLKLNISMSFIGVIMGEFLVSKQGIGYLIIYGTQVFNLDLVLSGVCILVILSYLLYKPINILEQKIKG